MAVRTGPVNFGPCRTTALNPGWPGDGWRIAKWAPQPIVAFIAAAAHCGFLDGSEFRAVNGRARAPVGADGGEDAQVMPATERVRTR